jgi:tetratricopeptide (TPR) repeat protein
MGLIWVVMGQWEQAIAAATEARALYQALGNRVMEADALVQLATAQTRAGLPRAGVEAGRAAVGVSKAIENPWGQADAARALGAALTECGEYAEALAVAEAGLGGARAANYPPVLIMHLVFLGHLYQQIGDLDQARALYLEAQATAGHLPNAPLQELAVAALCANAAAAEDWTSACAYSRQALALHDPDVLYDGSSFWCQIEALLRGGDVEAARSQTEEFGAFCASNRRYSIPYLRAQAVLAQHAGEAAQAIAHLHEAAARARAMELPGQLWPIEAALARAYQAQDAEEAAGQARARAARIVLALARGIEDEGRRQTFLASAERQGVPTGAGHPAHSC